MSNYFILSISSGAGKTLLLLTLQRYLLFFEKFTNTFPPMRQICSVVPLLNPNYLLNERFKCMALHRQNDSEKDPKLR